MLCKNIHKDIEYINMGLTNINLAMKIVEVAFPVTPTSQGLKRYFD